MKRVEKFKACVLLVLLFLLCTSAMWLYRCWAGPDNAELKSSIASESESVRTHVTERMALVEARIDSRADAIERRLERLEAKLDGIDAKLDRIARLISPPLPDGLQRAEGERN